MYIYMYIYIYVYERTQWGNGWFSGVITKHVDLTGYSCRIGYHSSTMSTDIYIYMLYIYTCYIYIHMSYICIYIYVYIYMYIYIYMLYIYTYMLTVIYYRWNDGVWGIIPNWSRIAFVAAYLWPLWPSWSMVKIHILPGIISYPNCTGIRWSSSFIVVVCACCNWSL